MKYFKLFIIALCMLFMVSCTDDEDPVNYITSAVVNNEGHLILTHSDGTIVDQGQVVPDVEVVEIPEEYVVNFYNEEGHIISNQMVEEGEDAFEPILQLPDHLIFDEWDTDFTNVDMNLNVYPLYHEETFMIEFDNPYGVTPDMTGIAYGETVTLPIPEHLPGFEFVGWYQSESPYADMSNMDFMVLQNTMLYARYQDNEYTVSYHVDGGTEVMTQKALYDEAVIMPEMPTKDGYHFNGWYYDQEEMMPVTFDFTITEDVEIYASWIQFEVLLIDNPYVLGDEGVRILDVIGDHNVIHIPSEIDGVDVTQIFSYAFYKNEASKVYLPDTLERIYDYAFAEMPNLTSIDIPNSVHTLHTYVFYNDTSLVNVSLSENVTTYGNGIFENTAIESIEIPEGTTYLGAKLFKNTPLTTITLPSTLQQIYDEAFRGTLLTDVVIPEGTTRVYHNVFSDCSQLTSLSLPSTINSIGYSIVDNTPNLTSFILHEDNPYYELIDDVIFTEDLMYLIYYLPYKSDISYNIPDTTVSLYPYAIYGNEYLQELEIPDDLSTMHIDYNYMNLPSILEYNVYDGSGLENYVSIDGVLYFYEYTYLLKYPEGRTNATYTVDSRVLYIYYNAFEDNQYIQSIILPDTLTVLYSRAFKNCTQLSAINMPSNLIYIYDEVFYNVDGITSLTIPGSTTYVGSRAFAEMDNLSSITISEGVNEIRDSILLNSNNVTSLHIPASVNYMSYNMLLGAKGIETFTVDGANSNYSSYQNGLYSKTFSNMIGYPEGATSTSLPIHSSTTVVQPNFGENPNIEMIVLGPNVDTFTAIIRHLPNLQAIIIERPSSNSVLNITPTNFGEPGQFTIYVLENSYDDYIIHIEWIDFIAYIKPY